MKKVVFILLLLLFCNNAYSQNTESDSVFIHVYGIKIGQPIPISVAETKGTRVEVTNYFIDCHLDGTITHVSKGKIYTSNEYSYDKNGNLQVQGHDILYSSINFKQGIVSLNMPDNFVAVNNTRRKEILDSLEKTYSILMEQIKTQYALLDTISYRHLIVEKYRQTQYDRMNILINGSDNEVVRLLCFGYEDEDSVEIHNAAALFKQFARVDTAYYDNLTNQFVDKINRPNPYYVLKLEVSNGEVNIDTSELKFDLMWIDEGRGASILVEQEQINYYDCFFPAQMSSKRIKKAMRAVLKEKPDYFLSSNKIPGLIYVSRNTIFVYCLFDMKKYELSYYVSQKYRG